MLQACDGPHAECTIGTFELECQDAAHWQVSEAGLTSVAYGDQVRRALSGCQAD